MAQHDSTHVYCSDCSCVFVKSDDGEYTWKVRYVKLSNTPVFSVLGTLAKIATMRNTNRHTHEYGLFTPVTLFYNS